MSLTGKYPFADHEMISFQRSASIYLPATAWLKKKYFVPSRSKLHFIHGGEKNAPDRSLPLTCDLVHSFFLAPLVKNVLFFAIDIEKSYVTINLSKKVMPQVLVYRSLIAIVINVILRPLFTFLYTES